MLKHEADIRYFLLLLYKCIIFQETRICIYSQINAPNLFLYFTLAVEVL